MFKTETKYFGWTSPEALVQAINLVELEGGEVKVMTPHVFKEVTTGYFVTFEYENREYRHGGKRL